MNGKKPTIADLLYFAAPKRRFVMLHGFVKKTQKTPSKEINVA
ncbi:MAG: type II toxin-antitoxin system RelE/ParE family toxin, partial [Armatimonadota bacterium]